MLKLDFSMKTLLVHALKAEAKILKQYFSGAQKCFFSETGLELLQLDDRFDLFRTGMGLPSTQKALEKLPVQNYKLIIHFGVSGSLSDSLPIHTLIYSHHFLMQGQPLLTLQPFTEQLLVSVQNVSFYTALRAVRNESDRQHASVSGAQAVDMESYAVAAFCLAHEIPLLALRCISDRAGESCAADFRHYFEPAANKLQHYLLNNLLNKRTLS